MMEEDLDNIISSILLGMACILIAVACLADLYYTIK